MKVSRRGSVQSAVCSLQHSCLHRPIPESVYIKSCAAPWGTCNQRVRAVCNLCSLTTAMTRHSSSWRTVEIRLLHFAILTEKTQVMMKICWITLPMIMFRTTFQSWRFCGSTDRKFSTAVSVIEERFLHFSQRRNVAGVWWLSIQLYVYIYIPFQQMAAKAVFRYITAGDCSC